MKLYCIEYDFIIMNAITGEETSTDYRIETFHDVAKFINKVKYLNENNTTIYGKKCVRNLKAYSGSFTELNIENVINPF